MPDPEIPDYLTATVLATMAQAAMSGLCLEGQLEIGVQEARKRRPDLSDDALRELASEAQKQTGARHSTYIIKKTVPDTFFGYVLHATLMYQKSLNAMDITGTCSLSR